MNIFKKFFSLLRPSYPVDREGIKEFFNVSILNMIEHSDGSATLDIEYTEEFAKRVKAYYGKQRCSKKMIEKFINDAVLNSQGHLERKYHINVVKR